MLAKSPAREPATHMLRPQRWEDGLSAIQHPHTADSLIPMFESMVDRALSRSGADPEAASPATTTAPTPNVEEITLPGSGSRRVTFEYAPLTQRAASKG